MEELKNLLAKCGFIENPSIKNNFQDIENLAGFQLPDDYKYYLNNYKPFEDFIGEEYVALYSNEELLELNATYKIEDYHSDTLLIGSNGASEDIGIKQINEKEYRVVIAQYIQDIDDHIEIGISFTDMLRRLNEGIKWFNG